MIDGLFDQDQKEVQMIVFQLGTEEYAVPITCVQEIIMKLDPTRLPKSPQFVEGVINLRGHIIPIIDGKKKFMLDTKSKCNENDARIMVLEVENDTVGLVVDAVSEVIHLKTDDIEPPPIDMGTESEFLWGVGKFENRLLILLNPQKFLSITEAADLKKLSKVSEVLNQSKEMAKAEPVAKSSGSSKKS